MDFKVNEPQYIVNMAEKKSRIIGLQELELTNDDLFVRKPILGNLEDTKVIIDETHVAIILNNGMALETLRPGMYPIVDKKSAFSSKSQDSARLELFYISKTAKVRLLWGTPALFDVHDPITNVPVKMGASGEIEIRILNPRQFYVELVGANKRFTIDDLKERLKDVILSRIEPTIVSYVELNEVPVDRIGEEKLSLANYIQKDLKKQLGLNYGLDVTYVSVNNINVNEKYKAKVTQKLINQNICPKCGFKLVDGSKFCNNCGTKVL